MNIGAQQVVLACLGALGLSCCLDCNQGFFRSLSSSQHSDLKIFEPPSSSFCGKQWTFSKFESIHLESMSHAVIFIEAEWSTASKEARLALCQALSERTNAGFLTIILNTDDIDPDAFQEIFGVSPQGRGEVFWIKNGRIAYRDIGLDPSMLELLRERINFVSSP